MRLKSIRVRSHRRKGRKVSAYVRSGSSNRPRLRFSSGVKGYSSSAKRARRRAYGVR